jgi:hypothetical protein
MSSSRPGRSSTGSDYRLFNNSNFCGASASALGSDPDVLEILVLGAGIVLVADERLEPIGAAIRSRYRAHLLVGHGFDHEFAHLIAQVQTAERQWRNRPGGFWAAGAVPDAARHAVQHTLPLNDVSGVLAMTDGIAACHRPLPSSSPPLVRASQTYTRSLGCSATR